MMKVGIDLVENSRIDQILKAKERIFLTSELEYINKFTQKNEHYCAIFCAKEAVFKTLDMPKINFLEIEILHNQNNRPYVRFYGKTANHFDENFKEIDISVSHTAVQTTAIAIATEKGKISLL